MRSRRSKPRNLHCVARHSERNVALSFASSFEISKRQGGDPIK